MKDYPPRVVDTLNQALKALQAAVAKKRVDAASQATIDVAQSALDLELLYRGNVEVDRFHLHAQQLRVHAANRDRGGVASEVAVLEWIHDRLASSPTESRLADLDIELRTLRGASSARDRTGRRRHRSPCRGATPRRLMRVAACRLTWHSHEQHRRVYSPGTT